MADLYLYVAADLEQPFLAVDPGLINYYSISSSQIWAGLESFGRSIDVRIDGYSLDRATGRVTGIAGYYEGAPALSLNAFDISLAEAEYVWSSDWYGVHAGDDTIRASDASDRIVAGRGADSVFAFGGNDFIHGNHGADYFHAGNGNDTVRGGHGHDQLIGGLGSDWIWGGQGANSVWAGDPFADNASDEIFVPVDSLLNPNGNPGGVNRDLLNGIETIDRIYMHGVEDSSLSFVEGVGDPRGDWNGFGVGIYANGVLEALVTSNLTARQVDDITSGGFFA